MTVRSPLPRSPSPAPHLGRRMARANRAVTNKLAVRVARVLPVLGIAIHVGRRTRNVYRTPVIVFQTSGFHIALMHGRDSDWVQNALAHGAVRLIARHRDTSSLCPRSSSTRTTSTSPVLARTMLRALRVSEFLDFRSGAGWEPVIRGYPLRRSRGIRRTRRAGPPLTS